MLATSTHDTKRGEYARARLNVLSHRAGSWRSALSSFMRHEKSAPPGIIPDRDLQHFLYQSLLGSWPLDHKGDPAPVDDEFYARVEGMWIKAARENKRRTDWVRPDEDYETALRTFLYHILRGAGHPAFARVFFPVLRACAREGMRFSLAQVACKCAAPGIPDVYQGGEFWDLSFVDPDNRRAVDFAARASALEAMAPYIDPDREPEGKPSGRADRAHRDKYAAALLKSWPDGMVKQYVLARCLRWRQRHLPVFLEGTYEPLETSREARPEVIAFRRVLGDRELVAVIPLRSRSPAGKLILPCPPEDCIYRNLFTGRAVTPRIRGDRASLDLAALFADFPVAWLWRETAKIPGEER
jgi:(1->4)-alpha-D-glucan 1-alpha-D-glucosylmutase